ncbi:MAG: hypothetical protein AB8C84_06760 [Oligoflexales bacterium]
MWIDQQILEESSKPLSFKVFIPQSPIVVLGNGNGKQEVYLDRCAENDIPVFRRCGGGGAVILHPGCLVVSVGAWVQDPYKNDFYFKLLNQSLIDTIFLLSHLELQQKGISDLAYGVKKVAGTSLFRSRRYLLYQASILVKSHSDLMGEYLPHPSKEPDYRKQRCHKDFVVGLDELNSEVSVESFKRGFEDHYCRILENALSSQLIEIPERELKNVQQRLIRSRIQKFSEVSE